MKQTGIILKSIFDSTDDVWFFIAPDYGITFFNKKAFENGKALHGRELKVGDNILDYTQDAHESVDERFVQCFEKALRGEIVKDEQKITYDVNSFWFSSKYIPVFIDDKLIGISITISDVSREKLLEETEAKSRKEIQALTEKKDEFLSIASHELKTPLTSIKAYNQMLLRLVQDGEALQFLKKEYQQVQKMERLIADLLDVTKISSGHLQYKKTDFDINLAVSESIEAVKHAFHHQVITFSPIAPLLVNADKVRIEQVLFNLITNAIKYSTDDAQVLVIVRHNASNAIITIRDFGIGINAADLDHVFDRFYRVSSGNSNIGGLGLGLYISSQIIKAHNGKIWAESEEGKGSTFFVSLPLAVQDNG